MPDYILATSGEHLSLKVLEIGDWNMDTAIQTTVLHGLTRANIRGVVSVMIRSDPGENFDRMVAIDHLSGDLPSGSWRLDDTQVLLVRVDGRYFDSAWFNLTPFNRGWITLSFVD